MSTGQIVGTTAAVATFVITQGNIQATMLAYNIGPAVGSTVELGQLPVLTLKVSSKEEE